MNLFILLLLFLNLAGLVYLTFIVYKKIVTQPKPSIPIDVSRPYKINLTRFNPFDNLGGDQSFILCLLDNTNSGVIITSLHTRDNTRVYAKAIKNGQSDTMALSKEEAQALIKTVNN